MATLNMSWPQREALARRLGVSARDLTPEMLVGRIRELADQAEQRSFDDSSYVDPAQSLKVVDRVGATQRAGQDVIDFERLLILALATQRALAARPPQHLVTDALPD